MCGHDTIGVSVALIEAGLVDVQEPVTTIKLDTPAGVVTVEARVTDGVVEEVSFLNAPALVLNRDVEVDTKDFGMLTLDISWGGNVYAILPAEKVGLTIEPHNTSKLIAAAQSLAEDINSQVKVTHPELDFVDRVTHVEFAGPPKGEDADIQNCVVALPKVVDRSPCGTGTSAKAALLFEEGKAQCRRQLQPREHHRFTVQMRCSGRNHSRRKESDNPEDHRQRMCHGLRYMGAGS